MADVVTYRQGVAGRITLNRPEALHALNEEMCLAMDAALRQWAEDDEVEVVIVDHQAGTRGFCAGGDIRMLAESGAADGSAAQSFFRAEYRLNVRIRNYPKPYVAFMDGVAMGGGVGVSVHGSHRVASERTLFAMPETGIGLFPDVGGGWFLPRLGPPLGMWLALTGERLKGGDVCAAGVATHYAESGVLEALKAQVCEGGLAVLEAMEWDAAGSFEPHRAVIESCFSAGSVEEIMIALEQIPEQNPSAAWARRQLEVLRTKSPRTLKVTHRQLTEGLRMASFEDNMRMEFRIGCRQVHSHDFQEGVRAVIIDKDNAPRWNPASLAGVSQEMVDAVFAPLGEGELTFE